jgi:tetratricopeptide (TPR) repeat protein
MSRKNKPGKDQVVVQPRFPLKETFFAAAALLATGLLVYGNSFAGKFIFDDDYFLKDFQGNSLWEFLFTPNSLPRPVVSLSLAFNYCLGGLDVGGYHAFNLAVHLLAALTLFGLVRRTLRLEGLRERFDTAAGWLALAVALLWLVHPLQTESVTYIVQRAESLAGLFYLLTLYCFMRGAAAPQFEKGPVFAGQRRWFALSILACALGMACKPILATAPLVVFAYDRIFLAKDAAVVLSKRWKIYAGLAATGLILVALISITPPVTAGFKMAALTPTEYAQTQFGVILHYLSLSVWPVTLCFDYMWPVARGMGAILPGALVVGALLLATFWGWMRCAAWSFPGLWFFIILAPTSSFMPIQDPAVEHRLYLPLAAVVTLVVLGAYLLGSAFLRRLFQSDAQRQTLGRLAAAGAIVTAGVLLGYLTWQRNTYYHERLTMWLDVLDKRPENWRAYNNAGFELYGQAKKEEAIKYYTNAIKWNPLYPEAFNNLGVAKEKIGDYNGSIADCNKALELKPEYAEAYNSRGVAKEKKGDYDGAASDYDKALKLNPRYAEAYSNRGIVREKQGCHNEAIADCEKALEFNPQLVEAYVNCGVARMGKGDYDGAIMDYTKVLELNPRLAEAYCNRGNVRLTKGNTDGAVADYNKALELNPQFEQARRNLEVAQGKQQGYGGTSVAGSKNLEPNPNSVEACVKCGIELIAKGDYDGALAACSKAVELNPQSVEAFFNRGIARLGKGDTDGAIVDYNKVLELNPQYAEAYNNRGILREKKGDYDGSIADCSKALELKPGYAEAYANRANARLGKKDFDGAIADCDKTLELKPQYADACCCRGNARAAKGDLNGAVGDFSKALELNPRYAEACINRGVARQSKGDYDGALADYDLTLSFDRSNWRAWLNKGLVLMKSGKEKEAQTCFDEGLKINPTMRSTLENMLAQARAERQAQLGKTQPGK